MQKILIAEIGSKSTVVNAFGNLNTENPKLLGQGISSKTVNEDLRLKLALSDLEEKIGPIGSERETPFYITSSLPIRSTIQEDVLVFNGEILTASEAIMQAAQLIYEEVGDVLVLNVGGASTNVYSVTSELSAQRTFEEGLGVITNAPALAKLIGEDIIKEHHGQGWKNHLNYRPQTPEEMALGAELAAAAISIALRQHCELFRNYNVVRGKVSSVEGHNLLQIRWIVGTGEVLTQLPNGLDIIRESIKEMESALFPLEGTAMLLDKDCIMPSLGVLAPTFREGAWQLLRESFGVEN